MWFYYSEKNIKKREEAEREREVKKKQSDFELDDCEFATDNHLYIVYFFGRVFYKYIIYFRLTLIISFILGWYYPIFHFLIIFKYVIYYCEFIVIDEEIVFDFHNRDESTPVKILLILTNEEGYIGFDNPFICMVYDETGYAYWDDDILHDLRSDRYYRYNLMKNWAGFSDDHYSKKAKDFYLKKNNEFENFYVKKRNKWFDNYAKEKVIININKEKIKNFIELYNLLYRRKDLIKLDYVRNKIFYLLINKKFYLNPNYNDYISLNKIRGFGKGRLLDLALTNYHEFGLVHNINKKYIYENKKDDYYN